MKARCHLASYSLSVVLCYVRFIFIDLLHVLRMMKQDLRPLFFYPRRLDCRSRWEGHGYPVSIALLCVVLLKRGAQHHGEDPVG